MQKGLTFGFCVEEMGGWVGGEWEMGLQGVWEAEGQALLPEDMWMLGGVSALVF